MSWPETNVLKFQIKRMLTITSKMYKLYWEVTSIHIIVLEEFQKPYRERDVTHFHSNSMKAAPDTDTYLHLRINKDDPQYMIFLTAKQAASLTKRAVVCSLLSPQVPRAFPLMGKKQHVEMSHTQQTELAGRIWRPTDLIWKPRLSIHQSMIFWAQLFRVVAGCGVI